MPSNSSRKWTAGPSRGSAPWPLPVEGAQIGATGVDQKRPVGRDPTGIGALKPVQAPLPAALVVVLEYLLASDRGDENPLAVQGEAAVGGLGLPELAAGGGIEGVQGPFVGRGVELPVGRDLEPGQRFGRLQPKTPAPVHRDDCLARGGGAQTPPARGGGEDSGLAGHHLGAHVRARVQQLAGPGVVGADRVGVPVGYHELAFVQQGALPGSGRGF